MEKKNYSKLVKLKILKDASEKDLKPALEKYILYPKTNYYWKLRCFVSGNGGLGSGHTKEAATCI